MTPNQAAELHDVIKTSDLNDSEQRRLHAVVDAAITTPPRKGHGYISAVFNGDPFDSVIEAVDAAGNHVPLELERFTFDAGCKKQELTMNGVGWEARTHGTACQAVLTLPVSNLDIQRLGDAFGPPNQDIDGPPDAGGDYADEITEAAKPDDVITKVETPKKREAPRGPHEHAFVNGVCDWCGSRER
mgnify:CR=1 FL=1